MHCSCVPIANAFLLMDLNPIVLVHSLLSILIFIEKNLLCRIFSLCFPLREFFLDSPHSSIHTTPYRFSLKIKPKRMKDEYLSSLSHNIYNHTHTLPFTQKAQKSKYWSPKPIRQNKTTSKQNNKYKTKSLQKCHQVKIPVVLTMT